MTSIRMHPSELAYAFSFAKTVDIIGWGRDPFLPSADTEGDPKAWYVNGADRMTKAGRLVDLPNIGLTISGEITDAILALVDPSLVLLAERKAGTGLRRMTVHVSDDGVFGMTLGADGLFDLTHYADLTAAAAACAGFLGASRDAASSAARIDSDHQTVSAINALARADDVNAATARLVELGLGDGDAASLADAMSSPDAAGVLSVLYCADNVARSVEPFSVMTNAAQETWIVFPPASLRGPMIIERSSAAALTARVVIGVGARIKTAA